MSLKDKAAKIKLSDLDSPAAPVAAGDPEQGVESSPLPRARSGVAAITHSIGLHHRVQDLEAQVAAFEDAKLVVHLDPKRVRPSKWKNRHELSFSTPRYAELKAEIEAAGGNVQAIKVRKAGKGADGQDEYEIVYGRRRHRACLELGLTVAAVVEEMGDMQLFTEMERENRNRQDLSPWEHGVMYKDALDAGLFASQRQLAAKLGIPQSNLSLALKLASLPDEVVAAFPSPLDLQFRWGTVLADALERDTARVMTVASELAALSPRLSSKEVLARLVSAQQESSPPAAREFKSGDKVLGTWVRDSKGGGSLRLRSGALTAGTEKKLVEFLERLLG
jgi:ParB family transcriptional regulator, chromosome partitioning protein